MFGKIYERLSAEPSGLSSHANAFSYVSVCVRVSDAFMYRAETEYPACLDPPIVGIIKISISAAECDRRD